jgi:hypothetical protein
LISGSGVDIINNYVYGNITSFSTFAPMGDTVAPNLTILFPTSWAYNYHNQTLNFSVYDVGSGLSTCWKRINNGQNVTIPCNQNSTVNSSTEGTVEGDNTIYMWANDSVGNVASASVYYNIDTTLPSIDLITPENDSFLNYSDVNFSFVAVDAIGIDTCQLWGNWSGGWHLNQTFTSVLNETLQSTVNVIPDGEYIWSVWCNDSYGNPNWHPDNHTFIVDTIVPSVSIISPENISYNNETQLINISADEINLDSIWFFNETGNETYNESVLRTFTEGSHTIYAYANDSAGNVNQTSVTFFIDSIFPDISIDYPANQSYNINVSELNYTIFDFNIDSC